MKVKVILNKDVSRIGQKGDILELAPSYAQNVLINKGLAVIATPSLIKKLEDDKLKKKEAVVLATNDAIAKLAQIEKDGLSFINKKVNDRGQLYAKITEKDIVDYIFTKYRFEINTKQIVLEDSIEYKGDYFIKINLSQNNKIIKSFKIKLEIK